MEKISTILSSKAKWKVTRITEAIRELSELVKTDPSRKEALREMERNLMYWKEMEEECRTRNRYDQ